MAHKLTSSNSFNSIIPFSQDRKSFHIRLTILLWDHYLFSNFLEAFLLIVEYAQVLSQTILLHLHLGQFGSSWDSYPLYNTFLVFAKIFTLGNFMNLQGQTAMTVVAVLIVITALCLIKYCISIYAAITAARNKEGSRWILRIWGLIMKSQGRVLYILITSFFIKIMNSISEHELDLTEGQRGYLMFWCILMIVLEFTQAFASKVVFSYYLPTKSFLAAKTNKLELINLTHKLILQICIATPIPKTLAAAWVFSLINFAFSLVKNTYFLQKLPYYKRKALYLQLALLSAVASLNFAYLAHTVLRSAYYGEKDISPNFGIICWPLIMILDSKAIFASLDRIFLRLLTSWDNGYPEMLIHKVIAIKEMVKMHHSPTKFVSKYKWAYLINTSSRINIANVLNLSPEDAAGLNVDFESKKSINSLFLLYLENLANTCPKECLVKLFLAYFYGKRLGIYGLSMSLLISLRKTSPSMTAELNVALLINSMQQNLVKKYRARIGGDLDLYTYVKSAAKVARLKEEIIKQADFQIKLCQEMTKDTSHLRTIFHFAWKIVERRGMIKSRFNRTFAHVPRYYVELPALFAHYSLILNYSLRDYLKYFKEYELKAQKYKQCFNLDSLVQENMFDRRNLQVVLSGRREDLASVIYACKASYEVYGRDVVGEKGFAVVNPSLQKFYQSELQLSLLRGDPRLMGRPTLAYQCHKEGYIIPTYFYLNLNPVLSQDLYYMVLIRRIQTANEYILLTEDGTIDACTKKIGYDLGILPKKPSQSLAHISQLSKELNRVNQAFNMKAFPEKHENGTAPPQKVPVNLNAGQADNIYTIYTTEGKTIRLGSLNPDNPPLWFNCKMENQIYGSIVLKVVLLEKSEDEHKKVKPSVKKLTRTSNESKTIIVNSMMTSQDPSPMGQSKKANESVLAITDISQFTREDEKEKGWIDFDKIKRNDTRVLTETKTETARSRNRHMTQGSPNSKIILEVPPSSRRALKNDLTSRDKKSEPRHSVIIEEKVASVKEEEAEKEVKIIDLDPGAKYSRATQSSGQSIQMKITQVFHEAVNISYRPRFYRVFLFYWYALLFAILVNQLRLTVAGTKEMRTSSYRKDILMTSDMRSYELLLIHVYTRCLVDTLNLPPLAASDMYSTLSINDYLQEELELLGEYNTDLVNTIGDLTSSLGEQLFAKNIRVYDSSVDFTNHSSFQAVDIIVQTGLKGIYNTQANLTGGLAEFEFVLMNDLNDLLLQSYSTSLMISAFAADSTDSKLNDYTVSLILTCVGVGIMAAIFSVLVYLQYKDDLRNMLAFSRIRKSSIKVLMKRMMDFKKMVQDNANFEKRLDEDVIRCYHENFEKAKAANTGNNAKGSSSGYVNYKGIAMRFYFYAIQTAVLLTLIAGLVAVSEVKTSKSLRNNQKRLDEVNFASDLRLQVGLMLAATLEMMSNVTNPVPIVNYPAPEIIQLEMPDLITMISEVPDRLKDPHGKYNPIIEDILFVDACKYLDDVELCSGEDEGVGLIQALSALETYITQTLQQGTVINSNNDFAQIATRIQFMQSIFTVILDVLNNSFDSDIDHDVFFSRVLSSVIIASLVFICLGVHLFIFTRVSESNNYFKKMLETFPARLVLSNFMLKSYLTRTSRGVLDAIKEEI